jgi:hypothetical protein
MKIERADALAERSKVTMNKLRMMIAVFFLTLALSAFVGVGPAAATGPSPEVEAGSARRALDSDFLRHNRGTYWRTVKAGAEVGMALKRRALDSDFLRHNAGVGIRVANTESTPRRGMHDIDFLRHNYDTHPWDAQVDVGKPLQAQGDQDRIEYGQHRR